jgi:N-hydroxyarylamine O-acetyltransferase
MERLTHDRRYKLINDRLIIEIRDGEIAIERVIGTAAELAQVFDQTFHIDPPVPAQEIFARFKR